jgi:hypothetical protein
MRPAQGQGTASRAVQQHEPGSVLHTVRGVPTDPYSTSIGDMMHLQSPAGCKSGLLGGVAHCCPHAVFQRGSQ